MCPSRWQCLLVGCPITVWVPSPQRGGGLWYTGLGTLVYGGNRTCQSTRVCYQQGQGKGCRRPFHRQSAPPHHTRPVLLTSHPVLVPGQLISLSVLDFMKKLDVKEIHGYAAEHGLRIFKPSVLNALKPHTMEFQ